MPLQTDSGIAAGVHARWNPTKEAKWRDFTLRFCSSFATEIKLADLPALMTAFATDARPDIGRVRELLGLLGAICPDEQPLEKLWAAKFGRQARYRTGANTVKGLLPLLQDKVEEVLVYKHLALRQRQLRLAARDSAAQVCPSASKDSSLKR